MRVKRFIYALLLVLSVLLMSGCRNGKTRVPNPEEQTVISQEEKNNNPDSVSNSDPGGDPSYSGYDTLGEEQQDHTIIEPPVAGSSDNNMDADKGESEKNDHQTETDEDGGIVLPIDEW